MKRFFLLAIFLVFLLFFSTLLIRADELDDINHQLENLKRLFNDIKKATDTNEATFNNFNKKLNQLKNQVAVLETEIKEKEKEVKIGEEAMLYQKTLLNERAKAYYKNINKSSTMLLSLLAGESLSESLRNFSYKKSLVDEDRKTIIKIALYIKSIEEKKLSLESEKEKLDLVKQEIDKQSQFLAAEITKSKKYQGELQQKIVALTARQQQIIAQKLASLNIPRSAATGVAGCIDDRNIDPGFSPRFGLFTYGVPNRVGMNQWGAKGRAEKGQNSEEILRAYYDNFELKKDFDTGITINVNGYGGFNIEDYVKRIYEIPADWSMEALKAQAVAARSYALAYTGNGQRSICSTEYCQVFKPEEKGGRWNDAVDSTRGWVMVQGGQPIKAWFSSTHGGYVFKSGEIGWSDTAWTKHSTDVSGSINNFSDLNNNAYDKDSPWFYCDWGARAQYNKTAWLKQDELADIANVLLLVKKDSGVVSHLAQTDKPNPDGVETWDRDKVKDELKSRGGNPYNNIADVSIGVDFGFGKTTSINISGDAGSTSFDGAEFKNFFNLRAPANIQIVGPLYNAEKR